MDNAIYFQALSTAARAKGKPLNDGEVAAIKRRLEQPIPIYDKEALRLRFIAVIRGAGYTGDAPERICAEHIDKYMEDVPGFIAMMEDYEKNDYDPE